MEPARGIAETLGGRKVLGRRISSLEDLREELRRGLPFRAAEEVVKKFGIATDELSVALHIPRRTIARRKKAGKLPADESDRLLRLARIAAQAARVLGTHEKASRWLHEPNRALGNRIPLSLLDTDVGTRQVEDVLGRIEHGIVS